jgi:carboxymethylenebutenolidase
MSLASPQARPASPAPVTIDRSEGAGPGRRPAVLLLHGADGLTRRSQYQFAAQILASQGYTVLFPHYFELTGEQRASYGEISAKYPTWLNGLQGVRAAISNDPAINPSRIALVGASLGGALALSIAARDRRVKAVVSYFAFRPQDLGSGRSSAPTLVLHGDSDRLVPVSNAAAIQATLRARGGIVETQIYPGEGHGFSQAVQLDAAKRTGAFLARYLTG